MSRDGVVTGASSGMGAVMARDVAARGFRVCGATVGMARLSGRLIEMGRLLVWSTPSVAVVTASCNADSGHGNLEPSPFTTVGTYHFFCNIHPRMTGTLIVMH